LKKNIKHIARYDNLISQEVERKIMDQVINNSRSMISIINREYVYEKVNTTFCEAHQSFTESIVGRSLEDVWGKGIFNDLIKKNVDLCFEGQVVKYEACFEIPGHGKKYFEVVFRPLSVGDGEISHILAETFDINELKKSKQAIIEKEEEFRKLETNLPIGFVRCNTDGKIINANNAFLKVIGCVGDTEIRSMNLKDFYPENELFVMHRDQLIEGGARSFGRVLLRNLDGTEIPCRITGLLSANESGQPLFLDFAIEDSSRELMLENRLLQAQKLETIGSLAGGIAHDFNNILTTISGYSEMIQEDLPEYSPLKKQVNKIQGAVNKAKFITKQILTFSRQLEQEKVRTNVSAVLKETIGFVKSAIPSNIKIKSKIPKDNAEVLADPTQLFRVFLNLMTNALQSMEDRGGVLTIDLSIVRGSQVQHELTRNIIADEYVLLSFRDTGTGMDPSVINRIFEPFFTTREVGKGTGLGLSVIHGIVSELEGEILVSSRKEEGSVFYVYLPVVKVFETPDNGKEKRKILFISGNKYESKILSLALENIGYSLIYVSDNKQLMDVLSDFNKHPDLIIYMRESLEIRPDDLMGLYNKLKLVIPCILITDSNQALFDEKLLNSGIIRNHLFKPVSLKEIQDAIQVSLGKV
jgi:two-component system, cell cycle sensor histidine kinase and response regulator CckA